MCKKFHYATAQSPLGQALYTALNLPLIDFGTNLVITHGEINQRLDAFAAAMAELPSPWRCARIIRYLPKALIDAIYKPIARNRYRIFGRYDACLIPDCVLTLEPQRSGNIRKLMRTGENRGNYGGLRDNEWREGLRAAELAERRKMAGDGAYMAVSPIDPRHIRHPLNASKIKVLCWILAQFKLPFGDFWVPVDADGVACSPNHLHVG